MRIMLLEFPNIADPPDVVADSVFLLVTPLQSSAADFLAQFDGFQDGAVAVPASADVVDFTNPRRADEFHKRFHQIKAVNVIPHLFAFVSEYTIRAVAYRTDHEVRKKSVLFCAGVRGASQTASAKGNGWHSEIATIFLHENIGGCFRRAEERVL